MNGQLKYAEIPKLTRSQLEVNFASRNPDRIALSILSASLYDLDFTWIEGICKHYLQSDNVDLLVASIRGIGNIARRSRRIIDISIISRLRELRSSDTLQGAVEDTLDDILIFSGPTVQ